MNRILMGAVLCAATLAQSAIAADLGVSVNIGHPGFYGRLDIGGYPPPPLIYAEPIVVQRIHSPRPPIYLRVPPGHAKHWHKYCHRYNACGVPVYFVEDHWYTHEYAPLYVERRGGAHDGRHDHYRHEGNPHRERRFEHEDHDRRRENGRGRHD